MKKLLALVLALVMTLGLATVSTSAAYTDANDIDYTEAVDVMTAVGVFQGKGDAFAPKDGLNRAEAAKLVAYLMLGNKTAESMKGSGTRFTDIPASHWASGYVEYLASVGVVSGVGGGQFNPNGQVTAVQFAKMLLVALGYDAELENFVGDGWSINIQKVANENDLFKGLDISANDALTREQAAQMCLNDLKADMVEYKDKGTTVKIGDSTVVTGAQIANKKTIASTNDKGKAIDSAKNSDTGNYILNLGEDLYSGDLKFDSTTDDMGRPANQWKYKTADVGTYANTGDLIFEAKDEVKRTKVYEVIGKTAADDLLANFTNTDATNTAVFHVYVDGVEMDDVFYKGAAGTKASPYASMLVDKNTTAAIGTPGDTTAAADNTDWYYYGSQFTGNGTTTQIYLQEDVETTIGNPAKTYTRDVYTIVITNEYLVKATADYSSSRENVNVEWKTLLPWKTADAANAKVKKSFTTSIDNTIEQEDFDVSGVKKDDFLVVTYSAKEDSFQSVKPATTLEGEVTKYVASDTVTIDGTTYKYAKKVTKTDKDSVYTVGNKVIMITDGEYILRVDETNATKDFVYLQDLGSNDGLKNNVKASVYTTAGTERTIDVKKLAISDKIEYSSSTLKSTYTGDTPAEKSLYGWYTYSVDDDGAYTLKLVDVNTSYTNATKSYDLNTKATAFNAIDSDEVNFLKSNATTTEKVKANNKTVFIVLDRDEEIDVYTGLAKAPTIKVEGVKDSGSEAFISYVKDTDGFATYVFVDLSNTTSKTAYIDDSTQSNDYLMVVKTGKKNYDTSDNNNIYRPDTVLFGGEITTKNFDGEESATKGVLYHKIKTNSKGYITGKTAISAEDKKDYVFGEGQVNTVNDITYKDGTVTIGGNGYVLNANNCVYLVLGPGSDPAKNKSADYTEYLGISGEALESYLKGYNYTYNYYGIRHDDNSATLDALYIWVAGKVQAIDDLSKIGGAGSYSINKTTEELTATTKDKIKAGVTVYITGDLDLKGNKLTIDGGTLNVEGKIVNTGAAADVELKNGATLYVSGTLVAKNLTVGCDIKVDGAVTLSGDLTIQSEATNKDAAKATFGGEVKAQKVEIKGATSYPASVTFENSLTAKDVDVKADSSLTFEDKSANKDSEIKIDSLTATGATLDLSTPVTVANNVAVTSSEVNVNETLKSTSGTVELTNCELDKSADITAATVTETKTNNDGTSTVTETKTEKTTDGTTTTTVTETVKAKDGSSTVTETKTEENKDGTTTTTTTVTEKDKKGKETEVTETKTTTASKPTIQVFAKQLAADSTELFDYANSIGVDTSKKVGGTHKDFGPSPAYTYWAGIFGLDTTKNYVIVRYDTEKIGVKDGKFTFATDKNTSATTLKASDGASTSVIKGEYGEVDTNGEYTSIVLLGSKTDNGSYCPYGSKADKNGSWFTRNWAVCELTGTSVKGHTSADIAFKDLTVVATCAAPEVESAGSATTDTTSDTTSDTTTDTTTDTTSDTTTDTTTDTTSDTTTDTTSDTTSGTTNDTTTGGSTNGGNGNA